MTIITKNEAANLAAALDSVAWADEIVVVDADSTDETVAIARRYTDRIVARAWDGYSAQKNYAATLARNDWILSLDADERVTPTLGEAILRQLAGEPSARGYRIPRVTRYLGRWIRSTDWYPDYQLRLYDRRAGTWKPRRVHESVHVEGPVVDLTGELEHHPYRDVAHHLDTINRYTSLAAEQLQSEGAQVGVVALALKPAFAFARNYALRGGFRDGLPGLLISTMNAYYVFLKLAKLWELQATHRGNEARRES